MTKRRNLIFGLVPWVALSSASFASFVACDGSDDTGRRNGFETPDSEPDAGVSLPDAAPPSDAARDVDSAAQRGPFNPADEAVACAGTRPCAKQLVAGRNHFCALLSDGTVRCWGENGLGELGGGRNDANGYVTIVDGLTNVTQVSAGGSTTCARRDDGSVHCWGENNYGQLGLNASKPSYDYVAHPTAAPVDLAAAATRVDVGERSVCAVVTGNKSWCWGNNERAQLARPDDQGSYVLGPALATTDPLALSKVAFGTWTVLGLTEGGEVATWGDVAGRDGLLGGRMTSITPDPAPNALATLESVTSLAASVTTDRPGSGGGFPPRPPIKLAHACALAAGNLFCWGRSDVGALGTGLSDDELVPALAPISSKAWPQQLAAGVELTCARMTDGSIQCAGSDEKGRLGTGQTEPFSLFFKPIASFKGYAVQVATSDQAVCALVKDGSVECWGSNSHRELATEFGDEDPHPSPVKITF